MVPAITLSLTLVNLAPSAHFSGIRTSLVDCSSRCYHNTSCSSFFYYKGSGSGYCKVNTVVYSVVQDSLVGFRNMMYYEWKHVNCDESAGWKFQRASWLCFKVVTAKATHTAAKSSCNLLTANTQSKVDQAYLIASKKDERVWVGGVKGSGAWRWLSGKAFDDFEAWDDGYPEGGKDCMIVVKSTPKWASDTCSKDRVYMCEVSIQPETSYCNY
ncbi:macrophage mannose receptor 1-like [Haliotis rubra]|uniref:macrophage mannose receptor 1-like n=1 Tax=Haliotis rubra TaxID=36100 RepID=UPI001EE5A8E3|nr:macrophage mannose receptor 1-like [Haliotis rubra]